MKGYVILSGSVDGATCEDDGFVNCANFGMVGSLALKTKKEAIEVRDQTIETDVEDFKSIWDEEDGYSIEVGSMNVQNEFADKYVDVYYNGDIINETIYKIVPVEFKESRRIPNQDEAYKQLLLSALTYNDYYENIVKWAKRKGFSLKDVASKLNIVWDKVPDGMSHFYFLDSIEDMLVDLLEEKSEEEVDEMFDDGYDFVDYLYDNELWKESY